jgi:hypothetical protein
VQIGDLDLRLFQIFYFLFILYGLFKFLKLK